MLIDNHRDRLAEESVSSELSRTKECSAHSLVVTAVYSSSQHIEENNILIFESVVVD